MRSGTHRPQSPLAAHAGTGSAPARHRPVIVRSRTSRFVPLSLRQPRRGVQSPRRTGVGVRRAARSESAGGPCRARVTRPRSPHCRRRARRPRAAGSAARAGRRRRRPGLARGSRCERGARGGCTDRLSHGATLSVSSMPIPAPSELSAVIRGGSSCPAPSRSRSTPRSSASASASSMCARTRGSCQPKSDWARRRGARPAERVVVGPSSGTTGWSSRSRTGRSRPTRRRPARRDHRPSRIRRPARRRRARRGRRAVNQDHRPTAPPVRAGAAAPPDPRAGADTVTASRASTCPSTASRRATPGRCNAARATHARTSPEAAPRAMAWAAVRKSI